MLRPVTVVQCRVYCAQSPHLAPSLCPPPCVVYHPSSVQSICQSSRTAVCGIEWTNASPSGRTDMRETEGDETSDNNYGVKYKSHLNYMSSTVGHFNTKQNTFFLVQKLLATRRQYISKTISSPRKQTKKSNNCIPFEWGFPPCPVVPATWIQRWLTYRHTCAACSGC